MKKVALSLLAFALVGVSAFAQAAPAPTVSIGMWGRQITAIGNYDNGGASELWAGQGASWGSSPRIVGLNINAHTDNVGFSITPSADNGTFGLTDQNKAWISPFAGLTIESGLSLETDTWRGTGDFGSYDWLRFAGVHGDSVTFNRIGEGGMATAVEYNKDGIGAWVYYQGNNGSNVTTTAGVANGGNFGAAYVVPSIGTIKAQVIGKGVSGGAPTASAGSSNLINAAFNLSVLPSLYEEVGVYIPTDTSTSGINYTYVVSDSATFTVDKAKLHLLAIATSYNSNAVKTDLGLEVGVGADYSLDGDVGLDGDVRYLNAAATTGGNGDSGKAMTGVSVGVTKGFGNGLVGLGFEYSTTNLGGQAPAGNASNAHWAIPLRLEESF